MLPPWLKTKLPSGENYERIKALLSQHKLHTVCEEARCPNVAECWGGGTATFMVLGDTCTRGCRFCSVASALRLPEPDSQEPTHLAQTIADLQLDYVVITTVCRDDLPDQGALHIARCVREVLDLNPKLLLEILIQDFRGDKKLLSMVVNANAHATARGLESRTGTADEDPQASPGPRPTVVAHNLETVERLTPLVRDRRATYRQSLEVLRTLKDIRPEVKTKSSLMLGLGETEDELESAFRDLRRAGVDILTLGQYLRPSSEPRHLSVHRFVPPQEFNLYGDVARDMGFLYVASGPFVRSSYRAGELFLKGLLTQAPNHYTLGGTPCR
ncbi:MAG: lipoyl synthase [Elusimicrobia bacterium]|nr:lipoyl synthase [Elusimicrobiota bacterium]